MDLTQIVIAACSVVATVVTILGVLGRKFEKISLDLRQLDSRLSKIEGYIERDLVGKVRDSKSTGTD